MTEPTGFAELLEQHLRPGAPPVLPYAIDWVTYQRIHEWDQKKHSGTKLFHRLTSAHFARTAHSRMNLGLAIDLFHPEHARGLRYLRARFA